MKSEVYGIFLSLTDIPFYHLKTNVIPSSRTLLDYILVLITLYLISPGHKTLESADSCFNLLYFKSVFFSFIFDYFFFCLPWVMLDFLCLHSIFIKSCIIILKSSFLFHIVWFLNAYFISLTFPIAIIFISKIYFLKYILFI